MEDGDWNLPCSARRLDHTRLHSCSVAELVPSTASAGRNFEQSSPSATADLSCSASVVTRAFVRWPLIRFRNEKSHTSDAKIDDPVRAYGYLALSSLATALIG